MVAPYWLSVAQPTTSVAPLASRLLVFRPVEADQFVGVHQRRS